MRWRLLWGMLAGAQFALASADYDDLATLVGPCARETVRLIDDGDLLRARDLARSACLDGKADDCPGLWIVYSYCETNLLSPEYLKLGKELVRRFPDSAPAQWVYLHALAQDSSKGGVMRMLMKTREIRQVLERLVLLDPDCHPARLILNRLYSLPALLGGDKTKQAQNMQELQARSTYYARLAQGAAALDTGDIPAASKAFSEARRLEPDQCEPATSMVKVHLAMGEYGQAFETCTRLTPEFSGDGTRDLLFVELAARTGMHLSEALVASDRYEKTARRVSPYDRMTVMITTALVLERLNRRDEAAGMLQKAEAYWPGAREMFRSTEKRYRDDRRRAESRRSSS